LKYQIAAPIRTTTRIQMTCPNSIGPLSLPAAEKPAGGDRRKQFSRKHATPRVRPAVAPVTQRRATPPE
jgi:hypothetical protein